MFLWAVVGKKHYELSVGAVRCFGSPSMWKGSVAFQTVRRDQHSSFSCYLVKCCFFLNICVFRKCVSLQCHKTLHHPFSLKHVLSIIRQLKTVNKATPGRTLVFDLTGLDLRDVLDSSNAAEGWTFLFVCNLHNTYCRTTILHHSRVEKCIVFSLSIVSHQMAWFCMWVFTLYSKWHQITVLSFVPSVKKNLFISVWFLRDYIWNN